MGRGKDVNTKLSWLGEFLLGFGSSKNGKQYYEGGSYERGSIHSYILGAGDTLSVSLFNS